MCWYLQVIKAVLLPVFGVAAYVGTGMLAPPQVSIHRRALNCKTVTLKVETSDADRSIVRKMPEEKDMKIYVKCAPLSCFLF